MNRGKGGTRTLGGREEQKEGGQGELLGALLEEECSGGGACWSPVCLRWKGSGPHSRWVVAPICLVPGKSSKVGGANTILLPVVQPRGSANLVQDSQ